MTNHLLHPHQQQINLKGRRFNVIRGGRRGGKTKYEIEKLTHKAVSKKDRVVFYVAPTAIQARSIIWQGLVSKLNGIGTINEVRLEIKVPTQDKGFSLIKVAGWENRENFRGQPAHHITFDETDTMKNFFIGWQEIFRPALIDTGGTADFIGTPKKENPNLRRLEKLADKDPDWRCFHFTSWDNPTLPREELEKAKVEMDADTYRQEIMAEYVDNTGALFHYDALIDVFSNTITKEKEKYLVIDVADDGTDKTVFSRWEGLEEYMREEFSHMNTENIIDKTREIQQEDRIPMTQTLVDAVGVGAGVASASLLSGIVGYKSSYAPIKTDESIVQLPNVHYLKDAPLTSEYANLRSQCVFTLADLVNNHKIASLVEGDFREKIIDELSLYQDASKGDGKRLATRKEDVKEILGRSPDHSDTWIMRMYFLIRQNMLPGVSAQYQKAMAKQASRMDQFRGAHSINSAE